MTLLVRDEEDIIRENLDYHLSRGVDFFIVTDNRSTDGTRRILEDYARNGVAEIIDEKEDDYKQAQWVSRMARLAYTKYNADWIINADADEFWWPRNGNLKESLEQVPPDCGALAAAVLHFVARPGNGNTLKRMVIRNRRRDKLKVCHRGFPDVLVGYGNHSLDKPATKMFPDKWLLTVLHFPRRTYQQYEVKVRNGGTALLNNPDIPGSRWHARYKDLQAGTLLEYWKKNIEYSRMKVLWEMTTGKLSLDTRLARYMKSIEENK